MSKVNSQSLKSQQKQNIWRPGEAQYNPVKAYVEGAQMNATDPTTSDAKQNERSASKDSKANNENSFEMRSSLSLQSLNPKQRQMVKGMEMQ